MVFIVFRVIQQWHIFEKYHAIFLTNCPFLFKENMSRCSCLGDWFLIPQKIVLDLHFEFESFFREIFPFSFSKCHFWLVLERFSLRFWVSLFHSWFPFIFDESLFNLSAHLSPPQSFRILFSAWKKDWLRTGRRTVRRTGSSLSSSKYYLISQVVWRSVTWGKSADWNGTGIIMRKIRQKEPREKAEEQMNPVLFCFLFPK